MSKKSAAIPKSTKFEDALGELENLIENLEGGEQSLEESLVHQQSLTDAEKKIKILMADKNAKDGQLEDFES